MSRRILELGFSSSSVANIKQKWKRPINEDIRSDNKNKSKLWKKYLKSKNKSILEECKQISNSIRKQTRNINKEEQLKIAKECTNNPKKIWNYVRSKTNSHFSQDKIGDLIIKDEIQTEKVISSNQEKAKILCDYFSTVFNKDAGEDAIFSNLSMDNTTISTEDIIKRLNEYFQVTL